MKHLQELMRKLKAILLFFQKALVILKMTGRMLFLPSNKSHVLEQFSQGIVMVDLPVKILEEAF